MPFDANCENTVIMAVIHGSSLMAQGLVRTVRDLCLHFSSSVAFAEHGGADAASRIVLEDRAGK
jgi:hypothetical protein